MRRKNFTLVLLGLLCFAFTGTAKAEKGFESASGPSLVTVDETQSYYIFYEPADFVFGVDDVSAKLQNAEIGNLNQQFTLEAVDAENDIYQIISVADGRVYYKMSDNNWTSNFIAPEDIEDPLRAQWEFVTVEGTEIFSLKSAASARDTDRLGPNSVAAGQTLWADKGDNNQWFLVNVTDSEEVPVAADEVEVELGDLSDVSGSVSLLADASNGATIEWSSSHPDIIDPATGNVTPHSDFDMEVVLTATITYNDFSSGYDYVAYVPTDNATPPDPLSVHYTFADDLSAGNTIADASGNGYDGEANDVQTLEIDGINVLDLGATNGFVSMPTLGGLIQNLGDFTISMNAFIAEVEDLDPNGNMFWYFGNSDDAAADRNGYMFGGARGTGWTITETFWEHDMGVNTGQRFTKGEWVNFTTKLNGNIGEVYINGELVASGEITLKPSDLGNTAFNFLGKPGFDGDAFLSNTLLNDFRIYNKSLTSAEMDALEGETAPKLATLNAGMTASLSTLSSDVGNLADYFSPEVTQYSIDVPTGTATVNVTAVADDAATTITEGGGELTLVDGSASTTIVVESSKPYVASRSYEVTFKESAVADMNANLKVHYAFTQGTFNAADNTVKDVSGSGFVGTVMNQATIEEFDGVGTLNLGNGTGYFNLSEQVGTDVIANLDDFTITSVVYVPGDTDLDGHGRFLWGFGNSDAIADDQNGLSYFRLPNSQYTITPESWQDGNQRVVNADVAPARGSWQRLTVVQSGLNIKIYLNDELVADDSETVDMVLSDLGATAHNYIGFPHFTQGDNYLQNVYVADFRMYDTAVDEAFISTLANPAELIEAQEELETALGDVSEVTADLTLLTEASNGASITWSSSHPGIIDPATGVVTPDPDHSKEVVIKATISHGTASKNLEYVALVSTDNPVDPLVVHFTFDNVLFPEEGDSIIYNATGLGYGGLAHNVEIVDIAGLKALNLGDDQGYVSMPTLGNLIEDLNDFTISVNVYVSEGTNLDPNGNMFWSFGNSDDAATDRNGYMFGSARGTGWTITETYWEEDMGVGTGQQITKGEWVNFTTKLNGNIAEVYINGELVASNEITLKPSDLGNTPVNFLGRPVFADDAYISNTLMNDFRIYTKSLTSSEMETLVTEVSADLETLNNATVAPVLTDLSVAEGDIDPAFASDVFAYTVALPEGTETANLSATSDVEGATISGIGAIDLTGGEVTAVIDVMSPIADFIASQYSVEISVPTSISDVSADAGVEVYPTVSNDKFYVEFAGTPGTISVYSLSGEKVSTQNASSSVAAVSIAKSGIYILHIESEAGTKVVKVVKQ